MASITGWGRGTWGEGAWNSAAPVVLTGVSATGATGSVTIDARANVPASGVSATSGVGSVTVSADANTAVTGVEAKGKPSHAITQFSTVGNAAISTDEKKFGTASAEFDGTGDAITSTAPTFYGDGDFTYEFWFRSADVDRPTSQWTFDTREQGSSFGLLAYIQAGYMNIVINGVSTGLAATIEDNTWYSMALERTGSTLRFYLDGQVIGSRTNSSDYSDNTITFGGGKTGSNSLDGYIDEYRASNISRYGTDYTPATSEFTTDNNTVDLFHFNGTDGSTVFENDHSSVFFASVAAQANVTPTGLSATSAVGSVTVAAEANVEPTGIAGTGNVGTVTLSTEQNISVTGVEGTGNVGSAVIVAAANVDVTGSAGTGNVGTVTVAAGADVPVTGLEASGATGTVTVVAQAVEEVTGIEATGAVGDVEVGTTVTLPVTGLQATGNAGNVTVIAEAVTDVTGLSATGQLGTVFVWGQIVPDQTPSWGPDTPSQSPSWTEDTPSQTPNWTDIAA